MDSGWKSGVNSYQKHQGALSAKTKGVVSSEGGTHSGVTEAASAAAAAGGVATTATPAGVLAIPAIAVFRAARVQMDPGSRIAFVLTSPFTFEKPAAEASGSGS